MKSLVGFIGILACCVTAVASEPQFRQASWGMALEEIQKLEGADGIHIPQSPPNDHMYGFEVQVAGLKAMAVYSFLDDRAIAAGVFFYQPA